MNIFSIISLQIRDVDESVQEAFNNPHTSLIRGCSKLERLLLAAIHLESRYTGRCEVVLENVANRVTAFCENKARPFIDLLQCAMNLASSRLILSDDGHHRLKATVALNVPSDDLIYVLTNDKELAHISDQLK